MTIDPKFLILILGMAAVTYVPRWFPLFFFSRRSLPRRLEIWLDFVPAAVLGALILPALVTSGEPRHLDLFRRELMVAIPTLLIALKTGSMGAAVFSGMFLFWIAGKLT